MNIDDFVKENNGKQVEVAGSPGAKYQCVDLVNAYIRDVLKLPIIKWTDAKDFPSKVSQDSFDVVKYTAGMIPPEGSIICWNGKVGEGHGHIAVARKGSSVSTLKTFDENWSVKEHCSLENHTYKNVAYVLIPKEVDIISPTVEIKSNTKIPVSLLNGTHFKVEDDMEVQAIKSTLNDQARDIKTLKKENKDLLEEHSQIWKVIRENKFNSVSEMGEEYQTFKEKLDRPWARLGVKLDNWWAKRANHDI